MSSERICQLPHLMKPLTELSPDFHPRFASSDAQAARKAFSLIWARRVERLDKTGQSFAFAGLPLPAIRINCLLGFAQVRFPISSPFLSTSGPFLSTSSAKCWKPSAKFGLDSSIAFLLCGQMARVWLMLVAVAGEKAGGSLKNTHAAGSLSYRVGKRASERTVFRIYPSVASCENR